MDKQSAKPNILIIVPDTLALSPLAAYGGANPASTPNLDRLLSLGTAFRRSYCATPQCTPSKAAILTGLYPHKAKMRTNVTAAGGRPFDTDILTIGQFFQGQGYVTGLFGNCHQGVPADCGRAYGFDVLKNEYAIGRNDQDATRYCLEFIEGNEGKPWLAVLFYHTAHDILNIPKCTPEQLKQLTLESTGIRLPESVHDNLANKPLVHKDMRDSYMGGMPYLFTEAEWRAYIHYYNDKVSKMDNELGKVLTKLDGLHAWEDTLFVLTGDHGDMGGAHGLCFKGPVMYEEITRVPLVIGHQGRLPCGEMREQLTHNTDIFPTLCDLAGFAPPSGLDGKSLKVCFEDDTYNVHEHIVLEYYGYTIVYPIRAVVGDRYKYVRYLDGAEELYDLIQDPAEITNLVTEGTEHAAVLERMRSLLVEHIVQTDDHLFMDMAGTQSQIL